MFKNGKINILNVKNIRKTNFPAKHFTYVHIKKFQPSIVSSIDEWIYENLNGRYYIGNSLQLLNNTIVYTTVVGFENPKEISFFKIACPHI